MSNLTDLLFTKAFQISELSYLIQECTFYGISLSYEDSAPIYFYGKFEFIDGVQHYRSTLTMKKSTISYCIAFDIPNLYTAGSIFLINSNLSIHKSLMKDCFGYYCTISANNNLQSDINDTVTLNCAGTDFMSLGGDSNMKYNNISSHRIDKLQFGYTNMKADYCITHNIKNCKEAFSYSPHFETRYVINKSNIISCSFQSMNGEFNDCYFQSCIVDTVLASLTNCFIDEKSNLNNISKSMNSSSMMDIPIIKYEDFTIQQEELTLPIQSEYHEKVNVSFTYDHINIRQCVFTDILISGSIDTVLLIQNPMIKKVVVERSFFRNITTTSSSGIIYISKHDSGLEMKIKSNFVQNCYNSICAFLNIKTNSMMAEVNVNMNSTVVSLSGNENSEYIIHSGSSSAVSYSNFTTNTKFLLCHLFIVNSETIHQPFNNFYNSSNLQYVLMTEYCDFVSCNFISIHCYNDLFPYSIYADYQSCINSTFVNCIFNESNLPINANLTNAKTNEKDLIRVNNIDYNWAIPKIDKKKNETLLYVMISVSAGLVVIIAAILIILFSVNKKFTVLKKRKELETCIIEDFG